MAQAIPTVPCVLLSAIAGSDCIGDSRLVINTNTERLGQNICTLYNRTDALSSVANFLLNTTIPVTGGNIVIPVGSTRQFTNLYTAYQSISGYIFNETANVIFQIDPEEISEPFNLNLSHRSSNVITISGTTLDWQSTQHPDILGSPITNVAGVSTIRLSATISFDPNYSLPAVGDYINITSLSGRHVGSFNDFDSLSGNRILVRYTSDVIPSNKTTDSSLPRAIQPGDRVLVTFLGSSTTSEVRTVSSFGLTQRGGGIVSQTIFLRETSGTLFNTDLESGVLIQIGTPSSFRNGTFTQAANSTTITFLTGASQPDAPTNSWLNEGDCIYALGQVRVVQNVAANNTCTINLPFRTGTAAGFQESVTTAVPYLIKTHFERYRGVHKVVAVNGSNVTVEVTDYGYKSFDPVKTPNAPTPGNVNYFDKGHRQVPLPRYGIHSMGMPQDTPIIHNAEYRYNRDKIFKTKLNYTDSTFTTNNACMYLLGDLKSLTDVCIVIEKPNPYIGLAIGSNGIKRAPSSINLGTDGGGAVGIYGFLACGYLSFENTNTGGRNLSITQIYNNFDNEIGISLNPFPTYSKLVDLTNTDPAFTYPLKNSFNISNSVFYPIANPLILSSAASAGGNLTHISIRGVVPGYRTGIISRDITLTGGYSFLYHPHVAGSYIYCSQNNNSYYPGSLLNANFVEAHILKDRDGSGWYGLNIGTAVYFGTIIFPNCFINGLYKTDVGFSFIELGNTQMFYIGEPVNFAYVNITGGRTKTTGPAFVAGYMDNPADAGGGLYYLYAGRGPFTTVTEGGDNPVGHFYFLPNLIYYHPSGDSNDIVLQSTSFIYNCRYAGGIVHDGVVSSEINTSNATKFNNQQNSAVNQAGTVLATGFNTSTNNYILN